MYSDGMPKSCPGCKHFDGGGYDSDTGWSQQAHCEAAAKLYDDGDCTEQVSLMLEAILFQLSDLNNCPMRQAKK
jgi:hypothetical protein